MAASILLAGVASAVEVSEAYPELGEFPVVSAKSCLANLSGGEHSACVWEVLEYCENNDLWVGDNQFLELATSSGDIEVFEHAGQIGS